MDFFVYFEELGFGRKEAQLFLLLYKLGTKPASTIAKHANMERTTVYKTLLRLVKENLVSETVKGGVKHFFVPDVGVLKKYVEHKRQQVEKLENNFAVVESELLALDQERYQSVPKIALYDGVDGIKNVYQDIYRTVVEHGYIAIKFFASNTFESQISVHASLKDYAQDVFRKLKQQKVSIDTYLGDGILVMEHITKTASIENLANLPAGNSAINIFVVGRCVYIIIYKNVPFALKLDSEDLAYAMHFLFEKLEVG